MNLLCIGSYPGIELFRGLGQLTPKQLVALWGTWRLVGERELQLGRTMWDAYTSQEVQQHLHFLQMDTSALPFVRAAFEAHLARLPSIHNGLGIVEQATLEYAADGVSSPYELFTRVGNRLNILGMGDLEYWHYLRKMSAEPHALLTFQGEREFPSIEERAAAANHVVTLTDLGRQVLAGKEDWAAVKELDEWYGGIRIKGHPAYRFDASRKAIVPV